jgi:S1-C subfamily serine protease
VEGQEVEFKIVSTDEKNDLVILKGAIQSEPVTFAAEPARQGARVVTIGYPLRGVLASRATVSEGIISNLSGPQNDASLFQISAPVQPGNSGGPLLDDSGHVIGIVVAKLDALKMAAFTGDIPQNVNFAIKHSVVTAFLDGAGITYRTGSRSNPFSTTQVSQIGGKSTVPIDCWR